MSDVYRRAADTIPTSSQSWTTLEGLRKTHSNRISPPRAASGRRSRPHRRSASASAQFWRRRWRAMCCLGLPHPDRRRHGRSAAGPRWRGGSVPRHLASALLHDNARVCAGAARSVACLPDPSACSGPPMGLCRRTPRCGSGDGDAKELGLGLGPHAGPVGRTLRRRHRAALGGDWSEDRGVLLSGDILAGGAERARQLHVVLYPNLIPLSAAKVRRMADILELIPHSTRSTALFGPRPDRCQWQTGGGGLRVARYIARITETIIGFGWFPVELARHALVGQRPSAWHHRRSGIECAPAQEPPHATQFARSPRPHRRRARADQPQAHQERGPLVIESGKGVWVTDTDGRRYIEAMSGLWCVSLGWGEERLANVAAEQMKTARLLSPDQPSQPSAGDRAGREADRHRALADGARLVRQHRLGGQRLRGAARLVSLGRAGQARKAQDHRPQARLPRQHNRCGQPCRASTTTTTASACRCRASCTSNARTTGRTPRRARARSSMRRDCSPISKR